MQLQGEKRMIINIDYTDVPFEGKLNLLRAINF